MRIHTERLLIRSAEPDDAGEIFSYRSDPVGNRYQGWIPASAQEVSNRITSEGEWREFVIIRIDENRLVGDVALRFTEADDMQAEVGCTLRPDCQGKGYATEALEAMVNHIFEALGVHRITASVDPRNTTSIRLLERLGFRKEAHFKESYYLRGKWVDDVIYAVLRKEWVNKAK